MKNKLLTIILASLLLTGCGSLSTMKGKLDAEASSYANAYDLRSGRAYVWNNKAHDDITKDLSPERAGPDIFFLCPKGDINFAGDELADTQLYPRCIWMSTPEDEKIPTVKKGSALIYVSDEKVPEKIIFERFADYGYSIGISNLTPDGGGHYYVSVAESKDGEYKKNIDQKSDAAQILEFSDMPRIYLDRAADMDVREDTVSGGGTVMGLAKNKSYTCTFYTGTFYQDYTMHANIRSFTSMEQFETHAYEFLHANCIKLEIPGYFKSGYYYVMGTGLFRYVSPEDEDKYCGQAFDGSIDWNDPIRKYDETGICIYDPSDEAYETGENSDPGIKEEDM